jgi:NTP pyrophosphatase (non-canonical NTP hydrolase)
MIKPKENFSVSGRNDAQGLPAPGQPTSDAAGPTPIGPLTELSAEVDAWIRQVGVRYFSPLTNMAILSEEVGEVARIMARRYGEQSEKESDRDRDLGEELSDVLFVVFCLANQTGTDLQQAWKERMRAKTARDRDRFTGLEKG